MEKSEKDLSDNREDVVKSFGESSTMEYQTDFLKQHLKRLDEIRERIKRLGSK